MPDRRDPWARFRDAVVTERRSRGWTQSYLADRANLSRPTLSNIESGATSEPERESVQKIARALSWPDERVRELLDEASPSIAMNGEQRVARATARRLLPSAPNDVLDRYVQLTADMERLTDEIAELEERYGKRES